MKKREICRKTADLGKFGTRMLTYSLTEDVFDAGVAEYGIEIAADDGETCAVRAVTPDVEKAMRLIGAAAEGTVTPVTLADIVEDWLGA